MKMVFYVNSQFGLGHYQRIFAILRAVETYYPEITPVLIYGGLKFEKFDTLLRTTLFRLPGLTFHQTDGRVGFEPRPIDTSLTLDEVMEKRRSRIDVAIQELKCAVIVLEYFPFSKQSIGPEVEYLLRGLKQQSRGRLTVLTSIRDYITIDEGFDKEYAEHFLDRFCSHILVHADPTFARFEESYGDTSSFNSKIHYTGYVVDMGTSSSVVKSERNVVVVSAGGGKDGSRLFSKFLTALRATKSSQVKHFEFHLYPGPYFPKNDLADINAFIKQHEEYRIILGRFSEFEQSLRRCLASFAMCGYNTAFEMIANRIPHVYFLPRNRTEQRMRADMLQKNQLAHVIHSADQIESVLMNLEARREESVSSEMYLNISGAKNTAKFLHSLL